MKPLSRLEAILLLALYVATIALVMLAASSLDGCGTIPASWNDPRDTTAAEKTVPKMGPPGP